MSAHQAVFPIATMARVLGVSKAGYYAWRRRSPSARAVADRVLMKRIRTIHVTSHETYGAPRIHAELRAAGEKHGRKRIARLMRAAGIVGVSRRRGTVVTTRRDKDARPAPDLVDRDFSASAPNQLWVADITFIPTAAGFLYLAVVLDAFRGPAGSTVAIRRDPGSHRRCSCANRCENACTVFRRPFDRSEFSGTQISRRDYCRFPL